MVPECPIDLKIRQPASKKFPLGFGEDRFDFSVGLFEYRGSISEAVMRCHLRC